MIRRRTSVFENERPISGKASSMSKRTNIRFLLCLIAIAVHSISVSAWHRSVTLKASTNLFVVAENGGGGVVNVNRAQAREWETFTLLDLNEGDLIDGDPVAFRTASGHFLVAEGSGGREILANRTNPAAWETFIIRKTVSTGMGQRIQSQDEISLTTPDNRFFVTARDGSLFANRAFYAGVPFGPERFVIQDLGDPAPLRLTGPFTAPQLIGRPVGVDQSTTRGRNDQTCVNSYFGRNSPNCYRGHRGTDFPLIGGFPTMDRRDGVQVIAVAPGKVVRVVDGNNDRCYGAPPAPTRPRFPPPPPPTTLPQPVLGTRIVCPGVPDSADKLHNYVVVLQDDGLLASYFHFKNGSVAVTLGQRVNCGQLLGKVGSSGDSTMPHLHFELARLRPADPPAANDFPKDSADPNNANDYFNEAGNARPGRPIDPYAPILWINLPSTVPNQTCVHSSTNRQPGESCGPTEDCSSGLTCTGGTCKRVGVPPGANCDANNVCGANLTCQSGRCSPSVSGLGGACSQTQACEFGMVCEGGLCRRRNVPPGGTCDGNQFCGPGLNCTNGRCTVRALSGVGQGCGSNPDCTFGLSCEGGLCRRRNVPPGGTCDANRFCGPNLVCRNSRCTPRF